MIGSVGATAGGASGASAVRAAALLIVLLLVACGGDSMTPPVAQGSAPSGGTIAATAVSTRGIELGKLMGLGAPDLLVLFGEPDFRRTEPPAELWQYRSADCVLDLFLYRDEHGYRVIHAETRQREPMPAGAGRCGDGIAAFGIHHRQTRL
jgi:hypothetical protein